MINHPFRSIFQEPFNSFNSNREICNKCLGIILNFVTNFCILYHSGGISLDGEPSTFILFTWLDRLAGNVQTSVFSIDTSQHPDQERVTGTSQNIVNRNHMCVFNTHSVPIVQNIFSFQSLVQISISCRFLILLK